GGLSRQRTTTLGCSGWTGGGVGDAGGSEGTAAGGPAPAPNSCVKSPGAGDSSVPPCGSGTAPNRPVNSPARGVSGAAGLREALTALGELAVAGRSSTGVLGTSAGPKSCVSP